MKTYKISCYGGFGAEMDIEFTMEDIKRVAKYGWFEKLTLEFCGMGLAGFSDRMIWQYTKDHFSKKQIKEWKDE